MSGPSELAWAAGLLVDAGLKATVVLGIGWAGSQLLRGGSASQRHALWALTLGALPLLPALAAARGPSVALDAPWLLAAWGIGVVVAASPWLRSLLALRRLTRDATPDPRDPRLRHSPTLSGPITWGFWQPVVLLPTRAAAWTPSARRAALAHERAHIARHDWAVHGLAWLVCALFWFHPGVWLARRALAREAEHAADDAVLAAGVRPSAYASLLLAVARAGTPRAALGASSSFVARRVQALLGRRHRSARRWPIAATALLLGALCLPALGAVPLWSASPQTLTCQPGPLP